MDTWSEVLPEGCPGEHRTWSGVVLSPFECENKGPNWASGSAGVGGFQTGVQAGQSSTLDALPSQTPGFRAPWSPRRDHTCPRRRVDGEAGAGRLQRRGHPLPLRAPPWLAAFARVASGRAALLFQHKGFEVHCFLWRKALAGSE